MGFRLLQFGAGQFFGNSWLKPTSVRNGTAANRWKVKKYVIAPTKARRPPNQSARIPAHKLARSIHRGRVGIGI